MSKKHKLHIINIRGCNASGKSYIVRELMKYTQAKPIYGDSEPGKIIGRVVGYRGDYEGTPIYFVGSYEVMSGGADHLMKHSYGLDAVCDAVRSYAGKGHVIFEGFIVSGLFGRFHELSKELGGITWCFMDTPLRICLQRITKRNKKKTAASGRIRKSVGTKHVEQKYNECNRTMKKCMEVGEKVVIVNYHRPMYAIHRELREDSPTLTDRS